MSAILTSTAREAAECLRGGGVIVYPTETVYGIGCDPWNAAAVARVFAMKRRPKTLALLLIADSRSMVEERFGALDACASRIADTFWPGPLTLVYRPADGCPDHLIGPSGGIAVRVTAHPLCREIIREFGGPVVSTSANISGEPPAVTFGEACTRFGSEVDMIMEECGPMAGAPSTLIDATSGEARCIREGSIPFAEILEAFWK